MEPGAGEILKSTICWCLSLALRDRVSVARQRLQHGGILKRPGVLEILSANQVSGLWRKVADFEMGETVGILIISETAQGSK